MLKAILKAVFSRSAPPKIQAEPEPEPEPEPAKTLRSLSCAEPASKRALAVYEIAQSVIRLSQAAVFEECFDDYYTGPVGAHLRQCRLVCKVWQRVVDRNAVSDIRLCRAEAFCKTTGVSVKAVIQRDPSFSDRVSSISLYGWDPQHPRHVQHLLDQTSLTEVQCLNTAALGALNKYTDFRQSVLPNLSTLQMRVLAERPPQIFDGEEEEDSESGTEEEDPLDRPGLAFLHALPPVKNLRIYVEARRPLRASVFPLEHFLQPFARNVVSLYLCLLGSPSITFSFEPLSDCRNLRDLVTEVPHVLGSKLCEHLPQGLQKLHASGCVKFLQHILARLADPCFLRDLVQPPVLRYGAYSPVDGICIECMREGTVTITSKMVSAALAAMSERKGIAQISDAVKEQYMSLVNEHKTGVSS